jgi:hypothetical protein
LRNWHCDCKVFFNASYHLDTESRDKAVHCCSIAKTAIFGIGVLLDFSLALVYNEQCGECGTLLRSLSIVSFLFSSATPSPSTSANYAAQARAAKTKPHGRRGSGRLASNPIASGAK